MVSEQLPEPILLSIEDTMHVLGLGRTTVHALVKSGELPAVKIGRRVMIRRADIEAFVAGLERAWTN